MPLLFLLLVIIPPWLQQDRFVDARDICTQQQLEVSLGACNISCCFEADCVCVPPGNVDLANDNLYKWCRWSTCVTDAVSPCERRDIGPKASSLVHRANDVSAHCSRQRRFGCGLEEYQNMVNCIDSLECAHTKDSCGLSCVNQSLQCVAKNGCNVHECNKLEQLECSADCGNNCLAKSCEALLSDPSSQQSVFDMYIVPFIIALSLVGFVGACYFFWKWQVLKKHYVHTIPINVAPSSAPTPDPELHSTDPEGSHSGEQQQPPSSPLQQQQQQQQPPARSLSLVKNRWQRGNLIGRGQFGTVYVAILPDGQVLAVKQIDATDVASNAALRKAYLHEMEALQTLCHPNIVMYYGACYDQESKLINLFMEYVWGGSLARLVRNLPHLLPEEAARVYIRQTLNGLAYLHSCNIIHRDIKGDNILINFQEGVVKISDFGSSRKIGKTLPSDGVRTLTGTPNWMAPEMITSKIYEEIPHKEKLDVWSLGCTIVELLNKGKPPWQAFPTPWAALLHIGLAKEVYGIPEHLSADCLDLVHMALRKDPEQRASVQDMLNHPWIKDSAQSFKFDPKMTMHDPDLDHMTEDWKRLPEGEQQQQQQQQLIGAAGDADVIAAYLLSQQPAGITCPSAAASPSQSSPRSPTSLHSSEQPQRATLQPLLPTSIRVSDDLRAQLQEAEVRAGD